MPALSQSWRGGRVKIGAESNHQNVGLEGLIVGDHPPGHWIQGADRRLDETNTGLDDVGIRVDHVVRGGPAKHHVQLREAEDEPVRPVDQHHAGVLAELR